MMISAPSRTSHCEVSAGAATPQSAADTGSTCARANGRERCPHARLNRQAIAFFICIPSASGAGQDFGRSRKARSAQWIGEIFCFNRVTQMADYKSMQFKGLDLNLLVALDMLLETRSVSRAAERMNLSQPAMSAALDRIRGYFGDELLVVHGKRMYPTAFAESLLPRMSTRRCAAWNRSSRLDPVRPATSQRKLRTSRVRLHDRVDLLVPLVARLAEMAPSVRHRPCRARAESRSRDRKRQDRSADHARSVHRERSAVGAAVRGAAGGGRMERQPATAPHAYRQTIT